jgi:glycosyltransferase involved in cell wall biosynthesis
MIISEHNKIILSICIPTFNRVDKTFDLVKNILKYEGNNIQIVVLDNCSTDETEKKLNEIQDNRFVYFKNEFNIGGMPNVLKSLTLGKGEFVMLCLDKDSIISKNLSYLIERIVENKDVTFGQCALNSPVFGTDIIYDSGISSLLNLAYTSEHPSGLFMKRDVLLNSGVIDRIIYNNKIFAFNPELLKAELSILGKSKRINIPIVCTETLETCEKEVSHTYKGDNIYFFPKNIIETFNIYIKNLYGLNLPKQYKNIVAEKIFTSLLNSSTFGYKGIMQNKSICMHHGINTRIVGVVELIKIGFSFSKSFIKSDLPLSVSSKLYICIISNMKIGYVVARNKFKK